MYAPRGRGSKNPENMRMIVLIGCVKSVQEGGRGSKKPENLRTYLMDAPLLDVPVGSPSAITDERKFIRKIKNLSFVRLG